MDIHYPAPLVQVGMPPCLFLDKFPGKNLFGVGNEQFKQLKFPLGSFNLHISDRNLLGFGVDADILLLNSSLNQAPPISV
jgi:hypothetical protein